ncbi:dual specificity protein phosphatase 13B-like isoform X1 [Paramormyrops kingsleyae]|uniref:dual specificity protein phosphatase 13B-like isoform X1 n=1 Tax=Paramormyrops kingsleyae TaxID=1676925 RepID=UPI003B96D111
MPRRVPEREANEDFAGLQGYEPPSVSELQRHLWANRKPVGPVDEVWSNLYISDESTARDKATLSGLGITHIVNGADGRIRSPVSLYNDMAITCYGVQAADHPSFDLSPFFYPTAAFIQTALSQKGRVLVHCAMGVSRSATLVLAYLMIRERLPLLEAICTVKKHRHICPNSGFLEQLRHLDMVLEQERATQKEGVRPSSRVQDAIQF